MPQRTYDFVQVDVFTQTPLAGNPLAIFPDAHGLNDADIASKVNLTDVKVQSCVAWILHLT